MLTGRLIGEVEFLEPEGDLEGELALLGAHKRHIWLAIALRIMPA